MKNEGNRKNDGQDMKGSAAGFKDKGDRQEEEVKNEGNRKNDGQDMKWSAAGFKDKGDRQEEEAEI